MIRIGTDVNFISNYWNASSNSFAHSNFPPFIVKSNIGAASREKFARNIPLHLAKPKKLLDSKTFLGHSQLKTTSIFSELFKMSS